MFSKLLAVIALAVAAEAATRAPRQTQFETALHNITDPIIWWHSDLCKFSQLLVALGFHVVKSH